MTDRRVAIDRAPTRFRFSVATEIFRLPFGDAGVDRARTVVTGGRAARLARRGPLRIPYAPMAGWAMTPASLRKVCVENDGYAHAPELNDVLHLHRKGIAEIENLEPYVGLKTIYLESNSVDTLEGLLHLSLLRCLYMAKNALTDVEGAVRLKALVTLDISENHVDSLEGLRGHQALATLVAAGNRLADVDAIDALRACPSLTSLDLSDNKLRDANVVEFLTSEDAQLADRLALLKFRGNPAVGETKSYRKTVVSRMRSLNYLDDAPVFPKDRRLAKAWARGGVEEEREERRRIFEDEQKHRERQQKNFEEMVSNAKRDAAAREKAGEATKPNPYRFMSDSAAAEARLMMEENVPEWRIEEMRAQETFPWQVQARREAEEREAAAREAEEKAKRAEAEEQARAKAARAEAEEEAERDAERARVASAISASITDETLEQMVAEQVRESLSLSRSVPVAVPMADDGPTPGIHVAAVAEEEETQISTSVGNPFPPLDAFAAELAHRADPGVYAAARAAARRRELERHAEATSAAGAGAGGWAPGAERRADARRSPIVYGTKSFDALWAQAKALGETLEAEEAEASRVRSGVGSRSPSTLASERRDEDDDEDDETERSDGSDAGGSFDSDADPYERHSVVTVAGARREETLFALD
jgi:dynein assembly factor 1, axonemal